MDPRQNYPGLVFWCFFLSSPTKYGYHRLTYGRGISLCTVAHVYFGKEPQVVLKGNPLQELPPSSISKESQNILTEKLAKLPLSIPLPSWLSAQYLRNKQGNEAHKQGLKVKKAWIQMPCSYGQTTLSSLLFQTLQLAFLHPQKHG